MMGRVVMKRGRPREDEDLEEKIISSEFPPVYSVCGRRRSLGNIRTLGEPNEASHLIFDLS